MVFEPIINTHKIKFKVLNDIFKDFEFHTDRVNIFINLDSILSEFYREDLVSSFMNLKGYENIALSSEIMNIAAHYRKYFYTRHKKQTFIYFYYMNKKPKKNISIYPDYCKSIIERKSINNPKYSVFNNILRDNLRLLSLLSIYVPQVYFLLSDGYEPSLVPYNIMNETDCTNIVLTKDPYEYQFISRPYTYILRLQYDKTTLLTRDNLIEYIIKDNKYRPENHIDGIIYEYLLPFISCKKRDLKGIKGKGKVNLIKRIDKLISKNKLPEDFNYLSLKSLLKVLDIDIDYDEIKPLYSITNIAHQYNRLSKKDKINLEEFLIDKYENRTIMQINSTYYLNNPVQLIELWEGVEY